MVKLISSASRGKERRSSFVFPWKVLPNEARRHFRYSGRLLFMDPDLAGVLVASRRRKAQTAGEISPTHAAGRPRGNRRRPADLGSANPGNLAGSPANTSRSPGRHQGGAASHGGAPESDYQAATDTQIRAASTNGHASAGRTPAPTPRCVAAAHSAGS